MRIIKKLLGFVFALVALVFAVSPARAAVQSWNLTGTWKLDFEYLGVHNPSLYDLSLTQSDTSLTGLGQYPDPGPSYSYEWNAVGTITGDTFTLVDTYFTGAPGTIMNMTGTVHSDGSISGEWNDNYGGYRSGTWSSDSGKAIPVCTQTGFYRDGINMTAALINPSEVISGDVVATGCNIGVYYGPGHTGTVDGANIYGANYYGVVVQQASADVKNSNIHNIGENPLNGMQHGIGIYYANIAGMHNGDCIDTGLTYGIIDKNTISHYQKGGIVASCKNTSVEITENTVVGEGPVTHIAQNGIQVSYGASGKVMRNDVSNNSYTGPNFASSGGIIVVGGPVYGLPYTIGTIIDKNNLTNNDVGVFIYQAESDLSAPAVKTNLKVINNIISNTTCSNKSGWNIHNGYQAGISDFGKNDKLINNVISGVGYTPGSCPNMFAFSIDSAGVQNVKIHANELP